MIGRHQTCLRGLYAIETDHSGERSFHYWREASAARTLFSGIGANLADLSGFDVIYLSGMTLAILPPAVRLALIACAKALKGAGKQVVFDINHRSRRWFDDATARASYDAIWAATCVALPSYDDEERLYPGLSPLQVVDRMAGFGPLDVVLKNGAQGPMIRYHGKAVQTAMAPAARVVETSGAGDRFNAGDVAAWFRGEVPLHAVAAGHRLASEVIGHHGAVIARQAMSVI